MPRIVLAALLLLAMVAVACGEDEPAVVVEPTVVADPTVVAPDDPPPAPAPPSDLLALDGLDAETVEAVSYCAEGARDWCDFVGPQLTGAQLLALDDLCDAGDDLACSAAANLAAAGFIAVDVDATPTADDIVGTEPVEPVPGTEVEPAVNTIELQADGVSINGQPYFFGESYDESVGPALEFLLGPPVNDTGYLPTDVGCPTASEAYRFVEWDGLSLTILDRTAYAEGVPHLASWLAFEGHPAEVYPVVFVGDASLITILPGVDTVGTLRDNFGDLVEIVDDPPLGPQFVLEDNLGRVIGSLDGLEPDDRVFSVFAGEGCGE